MHGFRFRRGHRESGAPGTRVSYANVAATLALFLAVGGGTAWAVQHHYFITSTNQIKPSVRKALHGTTGRNGTNGVPGATGATGANATISGVAAGGALSGTYPNPTLASGSVGDGAIASATPSVAEAGGTVSVSGPTATLENSFDRLGGTVSVTHEHRGVHRRDSRCRLLLRP